MSELYYKMLTDEFRDKLIDLGEDDFITHTEHQTKLTIKLIKENSKLIKENNNLIKENNKLIEETDKLIKENK